MNQTNESHPPRSATANSSAVNGSATNSSATSSTSSFPRQAAVPPAFPAPTTPNLTSGDGARTANDHNSTVQPSAPIENQRHRDAFRFWFKHRRNIEATCHEFGIRPTEFSLWAMRWQWEKRANFIDAQVSERVRAHVEAGRRSRLQRQKYLGRLMKAKAIIGARYLDPASLTPGQKIALVKLGTEFENTTDDFVKKLHRIAVATPEEQDKLIKHLEERKQEAIDRGEYVP